MPDNCNPKDCPVAAKVESMQSEFNRYRENSSATHEQMFDRLRSLEASNAVQDQAFITINEKLDRLIAWQDSQKEKPAKHIDSIIQYIISTLVGAFVMWLAMGMPGLKS